MLNHETIDEDKMNRRTGVENDRASRDFDRRMPERRHSVQHPARREEENIQKAVENAASERVEKLWSHCAASVPGRKHLRNGIPCQDASAAGVSPRPYSVVCDGRGSSEFSHHGAERAVHATVELIHTASSLLKRCLDQEDEDAAAGLFPLIKDLFLFTAARQQVLLASERHQRAKDFEFTYLLVVVGEKRCMTLQVGDGAIVLEKNGGPLGMLHNPAKGEFANMTSFVRPDGRFEISANLIPSDGISGVATLTDGAADKLIEHRRARPADGFTAIFANMREKKFKTKELLRFLTESFWEPMVQDDRSLALISLDSEKTTARISDEQKPVVKHQAQTPSSERSLDASENNTNKSPGDASGVKASTQPPPVADETHEKEESLNDDSNPDKGVKKKSIRHSLVDIFLYPIG